MPKLTKLLITSLKKSRHFFVSMSLLLLFSFLTYSNSKPCLEPYREETVRATAPQKFLSLPFAYNVFSLENNQLTPNKTDTESLTGEFPVASHFFYDLKLNDNQSQIIQSPPHTTTLVANKEHGSVRTFPLYI